MENNMKKLLGIYVFFTMVIVTYLVFPFPCMAQQSYLQFPGNCFTPADETYNGTKNTDGYLLSLSDSSSYFCPVNFYLTGLYIKSMSVDFIDNTGSGYISVRLKRRHFPSGLVQTVAEFSSSAAGIPGNAKGHVASNAGTKYIDTTYFTYWLEVYFNEGTADLTLCAIRIHFGS
jgi:hypothetical protein